MAEILLVRHGQVAGNFVSEGSRNDGSRLVFSGWNDVPLTELGKLQAQAVGKYLQGEKVGAIHSSDLSRARDTALPIAREHGLQVLEDAVWRELHFGKWSGLGEAELLADWSEQWAARQADPENVAAPDGESLRDLGNRVRPAWQNVVSQFATRTDKKSVVIVAHQGTIRAILMDVLQMPLKCYRTLRINNASVSRVIIENGQPFVMGINDVSHLKGI